VTITNTQPDGFPAYWEPDEPATETQLAGLMHLQLISDEQSAGGQPAAASTLPVPAVIAPQRAVAAVIPAQTQTRMLPGRRHQSRVRLPESWPLLAVLAVQAALSLRLVWSNTAFQDEALYLWAGHLEWAHWLHGTPISAAALPSYFSGAPVVYPPLGALADMAGGLAAARLLSLTFMLGATSLLHGTTRRLFDAKSAIFAAALFAGAGSVQFLGAFATYDAMALFLLALSAWLAVRAAGSGNWRLIGFLAAAGAALAVADAAKYAAVLFDPVVIAVAVLAMRRARGWRPALGAGVIVTGIAGAAVAAALALAGPEYWHGITTTTTARQAGSVPLPGVLFISGKWIGAVAVLAVAGAASCRRGSRLLGWVLAAAVFLAPADEARIHTLTSLFKHVGYGGWFGCIAAGYALSALTRAVPPVKVAAAVRVAAVTAAAAAVTGIVYAGSHFSAWPDESGYVAALRPVLASAPRGQLVIDDAQIPEYYLRDYTGFDRITNSSYFAYTDPVTHRRITQPPAAYADAIRHRFFTVISLTYGKAPTVYDPGIVADIRKYGGYRLASSIPYRTPSDHGEFLTWVREGAVK
jgi:dolichyl-phosphate-mannose-protein mannosyltransferase